MTDQVVGAAAARGLHANACAAHALVAETPSSCVLVADALAEIHAQLPPHLVRAGRQPADPPEVVEIWFPA